MPPINDSDVPTKKIEWIDKYRLITNPTTAKIKIKAAKSNTKQMQNLITYITAFENIDKNANGSWLGSRKTIRSSFLLSLDITFLSFKSLFLFLIFLLSLASTHLS